MSKRGDVPALKDVLEAIGRIQRYVGAATLAEFLTKTETQDAVVRNLEVIGEAVKNLSPDFRQEHEDFDWTRIAGLRDRLIHQYFSVDWDILWNIIQERLPVLKVQIKAVGRIRRPVDMKPDEDRGEILKALQRGIDEAMIQHKRASLPVVVERDGKIERVMPEDLSY